MLMLDVCTVGVLSFLISPIRFFVYFLAASVAGEIVNDRWTSDLDGTSRVHGAIVTARRTADDDWLCQGSLEEYSVALASR